MPPPAKQKLGNRRLLRRVLSDFGTFRGNCVSGLVARIQPCHWQAGHSGLTADFESESLFKFLIEKSLNMLP